MPKIQKKSAKAPQAKAKVAPSPPKAPARPPVPLTRALEFRRRLISIAQLLNLRMEEESSLYGRGDVWSEIQLARDRVLVIVDEHDKRSIKLHQDPYSRSIGTPLDPSVEAVRGGEDFNRKLNT